MVLQENKRRKEPWKRDDDLRRSLAHQKRAYFKLKNLEAVNPHTLLRLHVSNPLARPIRERCPSCSGLIQLDELIGALVCVNCGRAYYNARIAVIALPENDEVV